MNITTVTHDKGNYILLSIFDVNKDEDILTFDKWFSSLDEIDEFKQSKLFKNIFNSIFKIKQ